MNKLNSIQTFSIFCMEAYKNEKRINGSELLIEFNKYNVLKFLEDGFEVLHTQSINYIIKEISDYIKQRK